MDVLKLAALLMGGYFIFDWWTKRQAATTPTAPEAPGPATAETQAAAAVAIKDLVYQLAANANPDNRPLMLNTWEWNFYYQQLRGVAAPGPEVLFPGQPGERRMTVEEWWAGASAHGLSGIRPATRFVC